MPTLTGHTVAIRATQVIGASLYNKSSEEIGKVEDIVVDKTSNTIMFVAVKIGGVTTTSNSYHVIPWSILDFDVELGGYVVLSTTEQIAAGPAVSMVSELTKDDGSGARDAAYKFYKVSKDW